MTKNTRSLFVSLALLGLPVVASLTLRAGDATGCPASAASGSCCASATGCALTTKAKAKAETGSDCCAAKNQYVLLKVSGGDCGALGDKLAKVKGVTGVETCSTTHFTKVAYNEDKVRSSRVISAIKNAGYKVDLQRVTYAVDGLACGECSGKVAQALTKLKGVADAHVCHESKQAVVDFDPNKISARKVLATIDRTGFKANEVMN